MNRINGSTVFFVLTRPKLFGGVEPPVAASVWMISIWSALVFSDDWKATVGIFVAAFIIHKLAAAIGKKEQQWFSIYKRYMRQSDRYEPWPQYRPKRNLRPIGFGRIGWKK